MRIYEICQYCHGIKKINSNRCNKCGRFKNNLILGEYSPNIKDTLSNEDLNLVRENFIPKKKYPYYKENIIPNREVYPVSTTPKNNLVLDVHDVNRPLTKYVSKYDVQDIQRQKAIQNFYLMTNHRDTTKNNLDFAIDLIDLIEKFFKGFFNLLTTNILFRYIFGIVLVVIFLIWFLGGLFSTMMY